MTTVSPTSPWQPRTVALALVHLVVATAGLGYGAFRLQELEQLKALPIPRNEPLAVVPRFNDPGVVTDEQLLRVLDKLKPRLRGARPKVNHLDHALRFWGVPARFDNDPECLSGSEMREILLDHRQFAKVWGEKTPPFLMPLGSGVRPRMVEGEATASHVDHTLAGLAEVGTPLDFPVITTRGETQLRAILDQALRDFSLNQTEYEWSTLAFALYLPLPQGWFTQEGQHITYDRLADRIMRQELPQGVCLGNHRMHALVMLLRVDEQQPILSPAGRERIVAYLKSVTQRFVRSQSAEGCWDSHWPYGPGSEVGLSDAAKSESQAVTNPVSQRILATGHVLEWWSLAPPEVLPPPEVIHRAGQWLVGTIDRLSPAEIRVNYTFLSHAGRALALWRGKLPYELAPALPGAGVARTTPAAANEAAAVPEARAADAQPEPGTPAKSP